MELRLPNGESVTLENDNTLEEKKVIVNDLLETWMKHIESNWNNRNVIFFLDNLANYLVWHKDKEDKGTEDKEVLSIKKIEELIGKRRSRSIPFTSLTNPQKEELSFEGDSYD